MVLKIKECVFIEEIALLIVLKRIKIESLRKQQEEIIKELDILRNSMP